MAESCNRTSYGMLVLSKGIIMSMSSQGIHARSFVRKPKQPKAPWTRIKSPGFKAQQSGLRPDTGPAGGIKWRSKPKAVLDAVYSAIATMFKLAHPWCKICELRRLSPIHGTEDVHHSKGRGGLLLLDVRWYIPTCRSCHQWAGDNIEAARAIGVTCPKGNWNKETE